MTPHELNSYTVYVHKNKTNNMCYVGCTGRKPEIRWRNGEGYNNGQEKFYNAIKEYGWDGFEHIIIKDKLTKEEAWILEEKLINEYNAINNGYNAAYGGEKNYLSEASKEKLRQQRIGDKNPNYNPNKVHIGKYINIKNTKKILLKKTYTFSPSETSTDGRKSIESRQRHRELKLGANNPNYGKHTWCYGKKMTEEQKRNMYTAWTNERREVVRKQKLGAKNPQAKKVLCVNTGVIYDTIVEAAKAYNISERTVSDCCNGKKKRPRIIFSFIKEGDEN